MTTLKETRIQKKLTQKEAASRCGVSLRSYISYENDDKKTNTTKYRFLLREINEINRIDESHGILTIDEIQQICERIFPLYDVKYCYLFGSYAKGTASENSDIDLMVSANITGLKFYELAEALRESLQKKVDLLSIKQLLENEELIDELLKEGIKIYG